MEHYLWTGRECASKAGEGRRSVCEVAGVITNEQKRVLRGARQGMGGGKDDANFPYSGEFSVHTDWRHDDCSHARVTIFFLTIAPSYSKFYNRVGALMRSK